MASHHAPLSALGPVDWNDVPKDNLKKFMGDVFSQTQVIIESIPPSTVKPPPTGRARAQTDSAVIYTDVQRSLAMPQSPATQNIVQQLRKEWKETKVNPKDNPLAISVYKLAAKDGKGAWFARRSVHEDLDFEKWKMGLEREFAESMKVQGGPGSGNIRGIGAEKSVEHHVIDDTGKINVFQLSAQFPGPTSPRDFITLLLTFDSNQKGSDQGQPLRQYTVVSKPCLHPECPPRQGIIRGQYESVEIIRELSGDHAAKRTHSSADLTPMDNGRKLSTTNSSAPEGKDRLGDSLDQSQAHPRAIEWLMVTRSDPGGNVPRFMIERGTPPGIVSDAGKFLNWVTTKAANNFASAEEGGVEKKSSKTTGGPANEVNNNRVVTPVTTNATDNSLAQHGNGDEGTPRSNGLYGIISGAFGAATYVASGLRQQFSNPLAYNSSLETLSDAPEKPENDDNDDDDDDDGGSLSETSSVGSFSSALERRLTAEKDPGKLVRTNTDASQSTVNPNFEKELNKLNERRRKAEENYTKMQERMENKRHGDKEKDAATVAKLRDKHEKELAKQEAKYQRELRKLAEKREQEERKAVARRRKTIEREEKSNMSMELERTKAERDVALKQVELLQSQVGDLQGQNTMLVAKFGKMGVLDRTDSLSSKGSKGSGSGSRSVSQAAT